MTPIIAKNQMLTMDRRRVQSPICKHEYDYSILAGNLSGIGYLSNFQDTAEITFFCHKCKTVFLKGKFRVGFH